ncbi:NfeD family protein [uncultured Propionivibrio sp.]|uniref:NfeD family protein n=1 Tax=uncultured Propionivibrio sp. TaxID=426737 RepID=UPI0029C06C8D|nr:NfeD family protein [uncultured Propionivibrio sp.]
MFEWWHWMVLGLCLAMAELAVPAFFLIWFGIGALLVGLVLLAAPETGIAVQLLLWAATSTVLVIVWFRYLKPATVSAVGSSTAHVTGEVGILVGDLTPDARGRVRFQKPVLGADLWECYADAPIRAGARVRIVAVEGSFVKVEEAS